MITLQKAIKADQCMAFMIANSVYSLVIATAVPIYYETVTSRQWCGTISWA
jgi:hypothetical protein